MIGTTLGHYRIEARLGAGGMGEVYRAHDLKLDRPVALKFIHPEQVSDPEARQRFEREAKALASLDHANVGAVYGYEEVDGQLFMVLAFIEGRTLHDLVAAGPVDPERARDILIGAAEGLQAAHARGITHRDIKSTNVMVNAAGTAKIVDFGLAVRGDDTRLTQTGMLTGTPAYMAPEVIQGAPATARSDVFSFGAVMYEVMTGKAPFHGDNHFTLMHAILNESPASFPADLPEPLRVLEPIVLRCLEKDPDDRFATAGEIAAALRGEDVTVAAPRRSTHGTVASGARRRVSPAWFAGAAVVVVVVGLLMMRGGGGQSTSADPHAVAVLDFENVTGDAAVDWMQRGLSELIGTALVRSEELDVFDPQRLVQLAAVAPAAPETQTAIFDMARRNGIGRAIVGSIISSNERLMIQSRVIDLETGRVIHSDAVSLDPGDDIFAATGELIAGLQSALEVAAVAAGQEDAWLRDITTHSAEAYRLYLRGRQELVVGNWPEVARLNEQALALDSSFVAAQSDLVGAYWNTTDPRLGEALERAKAMRGRVPRREAVNIDLVDAIVHFDSEGTIRAAKELTELYPENRFFRYLLGRGYHTADRHEECIETLAPLVDARYEWAWTYVLTARSNEALGRTEEADRAMELGLEVTHGNAELYAIYGRLLAARGETERPREMFEKALASPVIKQHPVQEGLTHFGLGKLDAQAGDTAAARDHFLHALEILPDELDPDVQAELDRLPEASATG